PGPPRCPTWWSWTCTSRSPKSACCPRTSPSCLPNPRPGAPPWRGCAAAAWAVLAGDAPPGADLPPFGQAVDRAVAAAQAGDVDGVLALEAAFTALARSLEGSPG
ncbi:MAG TPA: hypothetical protein VN962_20130, partial [Polyangia bacterium]|nr:hypothetical protein [Polyangia bacterium]